MTKILHLTKVVESISAELDEHGYEDDDEKRGQVAHHFAEVFLNALSDAGYALQLRDPCRCGCGKRRGNHLCPCGCGHTYEDAVSKVMGGPMALNWYQASANIDEHPHVPCKW